MDVEGTPEPDLEAGRSAEGDFVDVWVPLEITSVTSGIYVSERCLKKDVDFVGGGFANFYVF